MRSSVCFLQSSNAASVFFCWAFPTLPCGSGYIARRPGRTFGTPAPLLQRSLAPKNRRSKLPASLRPKGSLSLTLRGPPAPPRNTGHGLLGHALYNKKLLPDFLSGRSTIIQVMSFTAMRHFPLPSLRWGNLPRSSRETRSYSSLFPCEVSGAPSSGRCGCSRR